VPHLSATMPLLPLSTVERHMPSPDASIYTGLRGLIARYDVSEPTINRWQHNEKLDFPKPMYIGRLRYWKIAELEAWERTRAAAA
jgi:predicted DNA-binding transcriptional regulator AlpA